MRGVNVNDLVSIITPSYKSCKFISQAIKSVLAQTYQNWEMIIVDDASPDNSNNIIEKYIKIDSRIRLIRLHQNSGPAIARNKAIEEAKGRYIAFLDADDLWLPEKLEKQIKFMQKNDIFLSYSSYFLINENSDTIGQFIIPTIKVSYNKILKTCIIGNLTAIYDSKIIGKYYMKNCGHEDFTLWLQILKDIDFAHGIVEPLAKYRISNTSISKNKFKAIAWQWNIYRNIERLNIFKSIYYFICYAINGILKYKFR